MRTIVFTHKPTYTQVSPNYAVVNVGGDFCVVWDMWVMSEMCMCVFHVVNDDHVCTVCNKATSHIHLCDPHWAERESVGGVCMLCFVFDVRNTYSTHKQLKTEHIVPLGHRGKWKLTFLFL